MTPARWVARLGDPRTVLHELREERDALVGVADIGLEPQLAAWARERGVALKVAFLTPKPRFLAVPRAFVRAAPAPDAETVNEARLGEPLVLYEERDGFARVATRRDGYLGWLPLDTLTATDPAPTHRLAALRAHLYAAPEVSAPRVGEAALGTELAVLAREGGWAEVRFGDGAVFVSEKSLVPLATPFSPPSRRAVVRLARRFLETPYVWGGVTAWGLDCSGLVQTVYGAFGLALPRDSDQQAACGAEVAPARAEMGDLLFFPGHVAISLGGERFLHANAHHMRVTVDTFGSAYGRGLLERLSGARRLLSFSSRRGAGDGSGFP